MNKYYFLAWQILWGPCTINFNVGRTSIRDAEVSSRSKTVVTPEIGDKIHGIEHWKYVIWLRLQTSQLSGCITFCMNILVWKNCPRDGYRNCLRLIINTTVRPLHRKRLGIFSRNPPFRSRRWDIDPSHHAKGEASIETMDSPDERVPKKSKDLLGNTAMTSFSWNSSGVIHINYPG